MAKTTSTTTKKSSKSALQAPLYNLKAEKIDDLDLSPVVFGANVDNDLIAQSLRVYLSNRRTAHAKVKDRGEVAGTTKKMYAQKGTGRARHSTAKAPQFVGGGSAHGPQGNQSFALKLNQSTRTAALHSLLSKFVADSGLIVIEDFLTIEPKTKTASQFINLLTKANQGLAKSKKIGIITEAANSNVVKAFRNIPNLNLLSSSSLNILDLSRQNFLILSTEALKSLK